MRPRGDAGSHRSGRENQPKVGGGGMVIYTRQPSGLTGGGMNLSGGGLVMFAHHLHA